MVIFVKVVEADNFTAAAKQLGMPKSTASLPQSPLQHQETPVSPEQFHEKYKVAVEAIRYHLWSYRQSLSAISSRYRFQPGLFSPG